jgi:peptidoglycan/xylan/chitin deacetylase (PgdA/CDA1 family)
MKDRVRSWTRDIAIRGLAMGRRIERTNNWIRFPYYHHIFEDERRGFSGQLEYLKGFGDFIGLDAAAAMVAGGEAIDGRYFCVTFDDGFKSCMAGAVPILNAQNVPAAFYVVTSLVGKSFDPDDPIARDAFGFKGIDTSLEFLSWDDCRAMVAAGMTIGSHAENHHRLSGLTDNDAAGEMARSKSAIEQETGSTCLHFCAPYGIPNRDFDTQRHGDLAKEAGYLSFATGVRGPTRGGADPYALKRDQLLANWGAHQLKYFLSSE